jgi:hypothetical protein
MALLYVRAGRLTAEYGGFWPEQYGELQSMTKDLSLLHSTFWGSEAINNFPVCLCPAGLDVGLRTGPAPELYGAGQSQSRDRYFWRCSI